MSEKKTEASKKSRLWDLSEQLTKNPTRAMWAFFILSAGAALIGVLNMIRIIWHESGNPAFAAWGGSTALALLGAGLWIKISEDTGKTSREEMRKLILFVGGVVGLLFFFLGVMLIIGPWNQYLLSPPKAADAEVTLLQVWKNNMGKLLFVQLACVGGLALAFFSLRLAKSSEREKASFRRLLYGYNTGLTALLLIAILGALNVLCYVPIFPFTLLNRTVDWTENKVNSLNSISEKRLAALNTRLHVYSLLPRQYRYAHQMESLLKLCREYNREHFDYTIVDIGQEPEKMESILKEHNISRDKLTRLMMNPHTGRPAIDRRTGRLMRELVGIVLVVHGPAEKQRQELILGTELFEEERLPPPKKGQKQEKPQQLFTGEKALISAIRNLTEAGKAKIYFTQGHEELSIKAGESTRESSSAFSLVAQLEATGVYEVAGLDLGSSEVTEIPDDAVAVVIAGPRKPFTSKEVRLIQAYLDRTEKKDKDKVLVTRGKLIVLFDVVPSNKDMMQTGLEPLLRGRYNVEVSDKRVLTLSEPVPETLITATSSRSGNPIAMEFSVRTPRTFRLDNARRVSPISSGPRQGAKVEVEPLLYGFDNRLRSGVWEERNLLAEGAAVRASYFQRGNNVLNEKRQREIPVAVTVSDSGSAGGLPPGHVKVQGKQTPRMVVFGDATWISDAALSRPGGRSNVDLFASCLAWLRDSPDIGVSIPGRGRKSITLVGKYKDSRKTLYFLPLVVMLLTVVAMGGGIWVARRR